MYTNMDDAPGHIASSRGGEKLLPDGYLRRLDKVNRDKTKSRKCATAQKCPGRVVANEDKSIQRKTQHNHLPNPEAGAAAKVKANVAATATSQKGISTHEVLADAVAGLSEAALTQLPPKDSLERIARRARQADAKRQALDCPGDNAPCDRSLADLCIPGRVGSYHGAQFILCDSGHGDEERIILFGLPGNLAFLQDSQMWLSDGTFKASPALWAQTYTAHGLKDGRIIPCVFARLPGKRQDVYRRMWAAIRDHAEFNPAKAPAMLLTDFEPGAHNAARGIFHEVEIAGCYSHLGQAVDRKVVALGLRGKYAADNQFRIRAKSLPALAFLPPAQVVDGFEQLRAEFPNDELELVEYFEETYVGRLAPNGRRSPRFPIPMWAVNGGMQHGYTRANNAAEGLHNAFANHLLQAPHPSAWKFIDALKKQQSVSNLEMAAVATGRVKDAPPKEKARNDRLARLIARYEETPDAARLLRGIAYNYMNDL